MSDPISPPNQPQGRQLLAGRDRMAVIRNMGFSGEEETKLMALANDQTVVDLFRTIMPDTSNQEYIPYMREALLRVLHCAGDGLDSMNERRNMAVENALAEAQAKHEGEMAKAVSAAVQEAERTHAEVLALKLSQQQRKFEKAALKQVDAKEAEARKTHRRYCEQVLATEASLGKRAQLIELKANAELKRLRIKQKLPFGDIPATQRMEHTHELPPFDESDPEYDPVEFELEAPTPDVIATLKDSQEALTFKLECMLQGLSQMYAHIEENTLERVQHVRQEVEEEARAAVEEAYQKVDAIAEAKGAEMAERALEEYKIELELAKPVLENMICMTDLSGADMDGMESEIAAQREKDLLLETLKSQRTSIATDTIGLECEVQIDPETESLLHASLTAISNMLAVTTQLAAPLSDLAKSCFTYIKDCVPFTVKAKLPPHDLPAVHLNAMVLLGVGGSRGGAPVVTPQCAGLTVMSLSSDSCVYSSLEGASSPAVGAYLNRVAAPVRCVSASGGGGGGGRSSDRALQVANLGLVPRNRMRLTKCLPSSSTPYSRNNQPIGSKTFVFE